MSLPGEPLGFSVERKSRTAGPMTQRPNSPSPGSCRWTGVPVPLRVNTPSNSYATQHRSMDAPPLGSNPQLLGSDTISNGSDTLPDGSDTFPNGSDTFPNGSDTFLNGSDTLRNGSDTLRNGSDTLRNGSDTI